MRSSSNQKVRCIAISFHLFLALPWTSFATESLEEDLQVAFTGDISSGTILTHNLTVICHTAWFNSATNGYTFNLSNLYPLMCTHIVFYGFYVESGTGIIKLNQNPEGTEPELTALEKFKGQNKWIKLLLQLQFSDIEFLNGRNVNGFQQRNFMTSLYDILKNTGVDGIYVFVYSQPNSSTQFLQEVCRQLRDEGFAVVLGHVHMISKSQLPTADYVSSSGSTYISRSVSSTQHQTPYSFHHDKELEILRLADGPANVLLSLSPKAAMLDLKKPCVGLQRLPGCCGLGSSVLTERNWPLGIGNKGSFSVAGNSSFAVLTLWRLCQIYNEGPDNWSFWRSDDNKEVSMCNGEYWISFTDRIYLESLLGMVQKYGLGGVDVSFLIHDDHNDGYCDTSNSSIQIRYPFFLHINEILSRIFPNYTRPLPLTSSPHRLPQLKISEEVCALSEALESQGIPADERHIWFCLASKETNFNSFSRLRIVPSQDEQGCSTTRFGMLGLSSPFCSNAGQPSTCYAICGTRCADLLGNAAESVKCVLAGLRDGVEHYHRYWAYCEAFATESVSVGDCARFTRQGLLETEEADSTKLVVWLTSGVVVLAVLCGVLCILFIRNRNQQPGNVAVERINPTESLDLRNLAIADKINHLRQELLELGHSLDETEFEIDYKKRLGSGCFGVVYGAEVRNKSAAVKALNEESDEKDILSLLSEIQVLSKIKPHPNIVCFLGHCIDGESELTINLFLEYCSNGSLESYLREHRPDFGNDLTIGQLIRWSYNIANGMNYLASLNIVHGDLAARNVLLDDGHVAKVSDFGLSRSMYHYNHYIKKGRVPLPWRWMSIEALRDMKFSSASDVWSYGVTLYEVFSLSSVPYPGLNYTPAFIDQLTVFNLRPGKPTHSDDYIYNAIIQPCWAEHEYDRPKFSDILNILREVLECCSSELGYSPLEAQAQE